MLVCFCKVQAGFFSSIGDAFESAGNAIAHTVTDNIVAPIADVAVKSYEATVDGVKYVGNSVADLANKAFDTVSSGVDTAVNATVNEVNEAVGQVANTATDIADKATDVANKAALMLHIKNPKSVDVKAETIAALQKDISKLETTKAAYIRLFNEYGKESLNDVGAFIVGKGIHNHIGSDSQMPYIQYTMQGQEAYSQYFVNALVKVLPKLAGIYDALKKDYSDAGTAWEILKCPSGPKCASILEKISKVGNTIADKMIEAFEKKITEIKAQK